MQFSTNDFRLTSPRARTLANIRVRVILISANIYVADSMEGSSFVLTQLPPKAKQKILVKLAPKTDLTENGIWRLLKVKHFRVGHKDFMMLHNNVGFISEGSKNLASESTKKNRRFRPAHFLLTPHLGSLRENSHEPYTAGKKSSRATFLSLIVRICLLSDFCGELRKTHNVSRSVRKSRSRSFKVVNFGTNWKRVCDFLLVINRNLASISHRFWDTTTYWYWLKIANFSYPLYDAI